MKAKIHPAYNEIEVVCSSCGTKFTTGSTKQSFHVEVCYKCHPFYSGEHRFLDTKGRVENFQKRQEAAKQYQIKYASSKKNKKNDEKNEKKTKSLRELLAEV